LQPHKANQKKQKSHQANAPRQTQNDNEQTRQRRRAAANSGLASCGVMCLNSSAVFQINFSAGLTVLCFENPHERQAANRQVVKKQSFSF
jgi:hypothetical protein